MKTKRKIFGAVCAAALALILAAAVCAMTACGGATGVFAEPAYEYYVNAKQSSVLAGSELAAAQDSTAIMKKTEGDEIKYALYSFASDSLVVPFGDGEIVYNDEFGLYTRTNADGGLSLYGVRGYICDAESASDIQTVVNGKIVRADIGGGAYKYIDVVGGGVTDVKEGLKAIASSSGGDGYVTEDYIVIPQSSYTVDVYDRDTFVLEHSVDISAAVPTSGAAGNMTAYLGNGDILLQYMIEVPSSADHDFITEGSFCALRTYVVDISGGKLKEYDTDFVIEGVLNTYTRDGFSETYSCDNLAAVYFIEDGYLSSPVVAEMSNSLGIGTDLTEMFGDGAYSLVPVDDGKFYDPANDRICDGKGKTLAAGVELCGTRFFAKYKGADSIYVYDMRTMESINADGFDMTDGFRFYGDVALIQTERDGEDGYMTYNARTSEMSGFTAGTVYSADFGGDGTFTVLKNGEYSLMGACADGSGVKTLVAGSEQAFDPYTFSWEGDDGAERTGLLVYAVIEGKTVCYRVTA
ncbi:MAG TPA: hypothetical protein H9892_07110 [Candidatus Protoclostridium stercorigallinarum]|uniref:Lipoprotein n=1 Tax=Candidatus Protoclostridium stercorigallinarum TaxID=2838741 RepID=A0A9D1Q1F3_9FIRM|nr:hypothetical protein [Candidatus Protoclostridium stercorigallinarum]